MGVRVGLANFCLDQSIGIDDTNTFQLKFYLASKLWAWHAAEINLRRVRCSGICMPNPSIVALIVSEISAFIRTDGQTDMAGSTLPVILIKNIYTLWGRKRFLLRVTHFPTNLVCPFTLRVTDIKNNIRNSKIKILCWTFITHA